MFIVLIRAAILYAVIIFAIRMMGKRQLGELQPTELVITILISNIASLPIEDSSVPMVLGIAPILVLVGFEICVSFTSLKNRKFRRFLSGSPVIVIRAGEIDENALRELRYSIDDLMESLRAQSVFDVTHVNYAIVETTGNISILLKDGEQAVTPNNMKMKIEDKNPPIVIVSDGELLKSAMSRYEISDEWLNLILCKNNIKLNEVFLLTCDDKLNYHIVAKEAKVTGEKAIETCDYHW